MKLKTDKAISINDLEKELIVEKRAKYIGASGRNCLKTLEEKLKQKAEAIKVGKEKGKTGSKKRLSERTNRFKK